MSSSPSQATRWFDLFAAFGRAPGPDTHAAVFHPDGEVSDAGMATPTPASQVGDAIAHVLRLMPDLTIDMRRYRSRGAAVFVEAANRGTINGTPVAWGATYRVHLRDGGVHQGRRFSDQTAPFQAIDWAGDDRLMFVEWRRGDLLGIDRFELDGSRIVSMRRYFDTLGLLAEHDPSITVLRAALLSNTAGR